MLSSLHYRINRYDIICERIQDSDSKSKAFPRKAKRTLVNGYDLCYTVAYFFSHDPGNDGGKTGMLLTIDVGNTNIVFGIFQNDKLIGTFRLSTTENRTADEIGLIICQYFNSFHIDLAYIEDVIIASVVPRIMFALTNAVIKYIGKKPIIVDEDVFPSVKYKGEGQLGADRSVCCEAALANYQAPLIVVDLGTATTIDAINETGWYMGGSIFAGLQTSTEALFSKAAKLPQIELIKPSTVLGYNTVEQIQAGSVIGYIGSVEFLLRETKREMGFGDTVTVVGTGGFSKLIADYTDMIDVVDSQLLLQGLQILHQKYEKEQRGRKTGD
jgi:type III pantothenate kinase